MNENLYIWVLRQTVNENLTKKNDCGLYANIIIDSTFDTPLPI